MYQYITKVWNLRIFKKNNFDALLLTESLYSTMNGHCPKRVLYDYYTRGSQALTSPEYHPSPGGHEIYNFSRPFLGYNNDILSLSDICMEVE